MLLSFLNSMVVGEGSSGQLLAISLSVPAAVPVYVAPSSESDVLESCFPSLDLGGFTCKLLFSTSLSNSKSFSFFARI